MMLFLMFLPPVFTPDFPGAETGTGAGFSKVGVEFWFLLVFERSS